MPPASLCVSYGVELECAHHTNTTVVLTQEEIIYIKQAWTKSNEEKVHLSSAQVS